jgi:SAM-dependent methyltransferase
MKALDRYLQRYRLRMTLPFLMEGARVLDIGCADGQLLACAPALAEYVGIDPKLERTESIPSGMLIKGYFPADMPAERQFDVIACLAVLEHIPTDRQRSFAASCSQCLNEGGHLLITVPSPVVDGILAVLSAMRCIDGMSLEEHYGFDVREIPQIFDGSCLQLTRHRRFQLGLNNLFVFRKTSAVTRICDRSSSVYIRQPHTPQ